MRKTREQRRGQIHSLREELVTKEGLTERNKTQRIATSIFLKIQRKGKGDESA